MTVEGFKLFQEAENFSAFDINAFLMSQSVTRFDNSTDRDTALSSVLTEGMVSYDKNTNTLRLYDGTAWIDIAAGTIDHGALDGLSDDDHPQYLTEARGDARYYTETEIDALLAGFTTDHGSLSGLGDDDHPQYLTEARGDARYYTETEIDALLAGFTTDHGGLTGLGDDDHPQYLTEARGDARYYTESEVDALLAAVSGSSPGGSDGQVQYNDGGVFGGAASLYYDDVNLRVGIGVTSLTSTLEVAGSVAAISRTGTRSDSSITVSFDTADATAYIETWNSRPLRVRTYNTQYYNVSGTDKMTVTSSGVNVFDDLYFHNNALITSFATSTNIDHIWHDDGTNTWHFCSDTTYKATGNAVLQADTLNVTTVNLNTSVHLTNVAASGSMRVQGDDGYIEIGPKNATYCHIYTDRGSFYFNKSTLYANSTSNVIYHGGNSNNYNTNWTANSVYADNWFRAVGATGLYFESYGTGIQSPIAEGGNYGSVATYGGEGGYEGFSIGGRTVFMHNMSTAWGIYNDVDNEWLMHGVYNAGMNLRYNGANRLAVESDRVENYSNFFETNATKFNHSYCGGGNNQIAFRWVSPYLKASVDNVTCATVANFSDERIKTDIVDWNEGMGMVRQLRPVTYTPKAIVGFGEISGTPIESPDVSNDTLIGLIAQEVGAVCPSAVARPGPNGEGLQSILPDHLFAILISAIKDIDSRLSVMEAA